MIYKNILKPILFFFDPEFVHEVFVAGGELLGKCHLTRWIIGLAYNYRGKDISKSVDGIKYRTPFMLSAGFDYNGRLSQILPYVGFGGEEIGSVTALPCEGNPKPRLTRLPKSGSIIVNKGLRNEGVEAIIKRLKKTKRVSIGGIPFVLGISIARTNDPKAATVSAGIEDYAYSFRRLNEEGIGDYYTINISCPNAFGGEAFCSSPDLLDRLLTKIDSISCAKPVYLKMPISISWDLFGSLLKVADKHKIRGLVIGNLNKDYESLEFREEAPKEYRGGLSGRPCTHPSTDLIFKTKEVYGNRFTIMGVGGVMSPETAREKFEAGAVLIQLITGMIFEGPGLIKKLARSI